MALHYAAGIFTFEMTVVEPLYRFHENFENHMQKTQPISPSKFRMEAKKLLKLRKTFFLIFGAYQIILQ